MTIIETHYVDQSETFIKLYNEGKTVKEIRDTLQIGIGAYNRYLRDNRHKIKTLTTTCPICGKTFHKKNRKHKYCTPECAKIAQRENQRQNYHKTPRWNTNKKKRTIQPKQKRGGHP